MSTNSSARPKLGVFLLPNAQDTHLLEQLSAKINKQVESSILLGDHRLPHITVAQFEAPAAAGHQLWSEVSQLTTTVTELTAAGLGFVPSHERDETWIEVSFLKAEALTQLQAKVLDSKFGSAYHLLSGAGESYRPHCTVALVRGKKTIPSLELDDAVLRRAYRDLSLVVGQLGDNYTLERVLNN